MRPQQCVAEAFRQARAIAWALVMRNAYVTLLTLDNAYVPAQLPYLVMRTLPYFPLGNAYATLIALDGHATMQCKCSRNAYPASGEHQPLPSQPSSSSSSMWTGCKNYCIIFLDLCHSTCALIIICSMPHTTYSITLLATFISDVFLADVE